MGNDSINPMVEFYEKHNISPVHQNISDIRAHYIRREKLYRTLGMPPNIFSNKTIMEVGPGGGYNSVAFFYWGANVDFVEPNSKAQEELRHLLDNFKIDNSRWRLYKSKIEDCEISCNYDVVIAEGFLTEINNKDVVISKLSSSVKRGGVVVVTCLDEISIFFEQVKRLLAWKLVKEVDIFNEKVKMLCEAFDTHLKALKFSTRPIEDWVVDEFLNPSIYTSSFSIVDCIRKFGDDFELLGSSPKIFTDYSWYKDISYNFKESIIDQFYTKRHMLLLTDMKENSRQKESNDLLFNAALKVHELSKELENSSDEKKIEVICDQLSYISNSTKDIDNKISEALNEAIILLKDNDLNAEKVSKADKLAGAFGRAQQYVSMVKKYTK